MRYQCKSIYYGIYAGLNCSSKSLNLERHYALHGFLGIGLKYQAKNDYKLDKECCVKLSETDLS